MGKLAMTDQDSAVQPQTKALPNDPQLSRSIDWFAEGESKTVSVNGVEVVVRYVGRKGRRGRIAITAPAGASFEAEG
jgi:hypothetical protein